jgi:hypothetical protein
MPDSPEKRGPTDRTRINLSQDHEVAYWTKALGVSAEELERVVKRVGPMVDDVRRALSSHRAHPS